MTEIAMQWPSTFRLGRHTVGGDSQCLVIAEAGVNHNGSVEQAHALIDAAADSGADVVKFQTFVTAELVTVSAPKARYQEVTTGDRGAQFRMLEELELPRASYTELMAHCTDRGVTFMSTPYDQDSLEFLRELKVAGIKIASTDLTNTPFLTRVGAAGVPVLLSTGLSDLNEVTLAVASLRAAHCKALGLLHCTSEYPAPPEQANLRAIETLSETFGCPAGFSDHTEGIDVGVWAVAAGANVIEKHFTLDRSLPGPDHAASVEPDMFRQLVSSIRRLEQALGDGEKRIAASELPNKRAMQKSLVARRAIESGQVICDADLTCKRPADGLRPSRWADVVGRRASRHIAPDEILTEDAIIFDHD